MGEKKKTRNISKREERKTRERERGGKAKKNTEYSKGNEMKEDKKDFTTIHRLMAAHSNSPTVVTIKISTTIWSFRESRSVYIYI